MRKIAILLIALMVISVGLLSGCTEQIPNNNVTDDYDENQSPTAHCSADPIYGNVPLLVNFEESSVDVDSEILLYKWDFDNGFTSNKKNPQHIFNKAGSYKITLTVTDEQGNTDTDSITITVVIPEPTIIDYKSYRSSSWLYIIGVVENIADVYINDVIIKATLYDSANNVIKTNRRWSDVLNEYRYDNVDPTIIPPKGKGYFKITLEDVGYYDHYTFEILSYQQDFTSTYSNDLVIDNEHSSIEILGYTVTGYITNTGSNVYNLVNIMAVFYDSNGNIVDIEREYFTKMYAGQKEQFEIIVYDWHIEPEIIDNYELKIWYYRYSYDIY